MFAKSSWKNNKEIAVSSYSKINKYNLNRLLLTHLKPREQISVMAVTWNENHGFYLNKQVYFIYLLKQRCVFVVYLLFITNKLPQGSNDVLLCKINNDVTHFIQAKELIYNSPPIYALNIIFVFTEL